MLQDWLYDEGEDATKAVYVAKMDEIRFVAGPIIQRYNDKLEEERQTALKKREEEEAARKAELDAKKAAEEPKDTEMKDADTDAAKPDEVEEPKE